MYVCIVFSMIALCARLILLHKLIKFDVAEFVRKVLWSALKVGCISFSITFLFVMRFSIEGMMGFILIGSVSIFSSLGTIYFVGLNKEERKFIRLKIIQMCDRYA